MFVKCGKMCCTTTSPMISNRFRQLQVLPLLVQLAICFTVFAKDAETLYVPVPLNLSTHASKKTSISFIIHVMSH